MQLIDIHGYDDYGKLSSKTITGAVTQTYYYSYKNTASHELSYVSFGGYNFIPLSDVNGRNTGREVRLYGDRIAGEYITYRKVGDHATNMPATVWYASGDKIADSIRYKYDSRGNISEIIKNGKSSVKYTYDLLNRLVKEENTELGKTVEFEYDTNGNIQRKTESGSAKEYEYDGDKLVSYNGKTCVYNNIGNPTTYKGTALTWQYGNRLTKYGSTTLAYDSLGRLTKRGSISLTYDNDGKVIKQSDGLEFIYDASGIAGIRYNNKIYFYRKDAQGNIIAILDTSGKVIAKYEYDAWGNGKSYCLNFVNSEEVFQTEDSSVSMNTNYAVNKTLSLNNPFRYRGYYFVKEISLYYLQTRYYDPEVGRFISQDSVEYADPETINGLNLYAYCGNNPTNYLDPSGNAKWWQWLLFGIGAALVVAAAVVLTVASGGAATGLIGAIAIGAAKGALIGAAVGSVVGIAGGAIYAGVTDADMGQSILSGFLMGFGIGAVVGAVVGGAAGYISYTPNKITGFTQHGLNQVIQRNGHGVSNRAILDTVKAPQKIVKQGFFKSTYKFVSEKAVVVLNKTGKLVTAWVKKSLWWRF
ncbi:MAG: RHS repeat-associated core domain-containing protein [Clostridiales bacterium]|nr:RHS repeat-associated core domain-containing protein [Clostridiales bacterium]